MSVLPQSAVAPLKKHLDRVRWLHARDLTRGAGRVALPGALERKYPKAGRYDIRTVQELLGHKDVSTTMVYAHVLNRGGRAVLSPADRL